MNRPPDTKYTFLSLGAGVQSSTMALMAAHGEIDPMPDAAIFADTQAEPAAVMDWLDWLETQLPFPVYRVTAGSLADKEMELRRSKKTGLLYRKSQIPAFCKNDDGSIGIVSRKCTADFKVVPLTKKVRELAQIKKGQKEITVTQWIGISLDEVQRMKSSRDKWSQMRWPLIEMRLSRADCKRWMAEHSYPEPPRSACLFCPFHSDAEWRRVRDGDPAEWQYVIDFERRMQEQFDKNETARSRPFLHPSCVPIDQVDLRSDIEKGQLTLEGMWNTIQNECEGLCGV